MPINYDPGLSQRAGYLETKEVDIQPRDRQTLLHLMFWLVYTKEGRDFLGDNSADEQGNLTAEKRQKLEKKFGQFGITSPDLMDALVEAHVAAQRYKHAFLAERTNANRKVMDAAEKVYQQKMSFITWCLWEDSQVHEFSMIW